MTSQSPDAGGLDAFFPPRRPLLRPGWDDDLKAFVKSWATEYVWLDETEAIHPNHWQKAGYVHLQALCGTRLAALPPRLSRDDIFNVAQGTHADPITAFLWTMAWGYSNDNTGASRTNDIAGRPNAANNLAQIVGLAQAGNIQGAFTDLHGPLNIRGLATSFGSKLIYFAGFNRQSQSAQPLILDQRVAAALAEVINPATGAQTRWVYQTRLWSHYWEYCDLVREMRYRYVPEARIDMVEHWLWLVGAKLCWHHDAIRRNGQYPR